MCIVVFCHELWEFVGHQVVVCHALLQCFILLPMPCYSLSVNVFVCHYCSTKSIVGDAVPFNGQLSHQMDSYLIKSLLGIAAHVVNCIAGDREQNAQQDNTLYS